MKWYGIGEWWAQTFPLKEKQYKNMGVEYAVYARLCDNDKVLVLAMLREKNAKETALSLFIGIGVGIIISITLLITGWVF